MEEELFLFYSEIGCAGDVLKLSGREGALEGAALVGNDVRAAGFSGIDEVEAKTVRIIDERRDGELRIRVAGFFAYEDGEGGEGELTLRCFRREGEVGFAFLSGSEVHVEPLVICEGGVKSGFAGIDSQDRRFARDSVRGNRRCQREGSEGSG